MNGVKDYYKLMHLAREAELLTVALKLNIFRYLELPKTSTELAIDLEYNERNLEIFLKALVAVNLLDYSNNRFVNMPPTNEYLNSSSSQFIGDAILFRNKMLTLDGIEERIKYGPLDQISCKKDGVGLYDFKKLAESTINEMYLTRVNNVIATVESLFNKEASIKTLDLGGGNGVLGIELAKAFPNSKACIFEHPSVIQVAENLIEENQIGDRVSVIKGDFNKDFIGEGYDFIIASGIMDFASHYLENFVQKLKNSLNPNGYLYVITHGVSDDFTSPKETIVGWLNGRLKGSDLLTKESKILDTLSQNSFSKIELNNAITGGLKIHLFRMNL